MSVGEFAVLVVAALAWQEFYAVLTLHRLRARLGPLVKWLEGERGERGAVEAWQGAASLPLELLRLWWGGGRAVLRVRARPEAAPRRTRGAPLRRGRGRGPQPASSPAAPGRRVGDQRRHRHHRGG